MMPCVRLSDRPFWTSKTGNEGCKNLKFSGSIQCWLGDRKGIQPVRSGCWFVGGDDLTGFNSCHPTYVILSSNKIQNGDILVLAHSGCPEKWPLNEYPYVCKRNIVGLGYSIWVR